MSDADKIKYLEGWVERLASQKQQLEYRLEEKERNRQGYIELHKNGCILRRELTERVKQLETELAAAKEEIQQYSMKPKEAKQ